MNDQAIAIVSDVKEDPATKAEHGTYAMAQKEKKNGGRMCLECRRAFNAYIREWRSRKGLSQAREKAQTAAASRALWRLAGMHPSQYKALLQDEMQKAGWDLPRRRKH